MSEIKWLKLARFKRLISQNGGYLNSLKTIFRTDDLKSGKLVGTDKSGNKYYQNDKFFFGRNRWVVYGKIGWDYEGSCVPPEWHRWLHYIGDEVPSDSLQKQTWMAEHVSNKTLEQDKKYIPYSTTKPKVEEWIPSQEK